MRRGERVLVYGGLMAAILLAAVGRFGEPSAAASAAGSRLRAEPEAARVAVCDVYKITDDMIESDRYAPEIKAEEARLRASIEPIEKDIMALQEALRSAAKESDEAKNIAVALQRKQQEYIQTNQRIQHEFEAFVARTYVEAYEEVRASVDAVAEDLGFTHVIAARSRDAKIETGEIKRVIESVLARPVIKSPEGSDITAEVMRDLKLD